MQIIFSREVANELANKFTVLELETFNVEGQMLETFCVVPADKISPTEYPTLAASCDLHAQLAEAIKQTDYTFCEITIPALMGKFGGELDSFYEIISERIALSNTTYQT